MKPANNMLTECITLGYLTNEFAAFAMEVGGRVINSNAELREHVRQDAFSRFCENFVRKWRNINPDGNVRSYLASIAYTSLQDEKRKFHKEYDKKERLYNYTETHKESYEVQKKEIDEKLLKRLDIENGDKMNREQRIVVRREVVRLHKEGLTNYRIAKHVGLHESTILRWLRKWEKQQKAFFFYDGRLKKYRKKRKQK